MRLLRQSISDSVSIKDALGRPPKANTRLGFVQSMNSERSLYKKEQLSSMFMIQASNTYEDKKIQGAKDHKTWIIFQYQLDWDCHHLPGSL